MNVTKKKKLCFNAPDSNINYSLSNPLVQKLTFDCILLPSNNINLHIVNVFKLFQEEKKLLELKVKYEKSTEKKKHDRFVYYLYTRNYI